MSELETDKAKVDNLSFELHHTQEENKSVHDRLFKAEADLQDITTKLDKIPLPIRAHFTGESLEPKPEPETPKSETTKDVPINERTSTTNVDWKPTVEMKPVQQIGR